MCNCKSQCCGQSSCGCDSKSKCCGSDKKCGCESQSCGSNKSSCCGGKDAFANKFLELADCAWKEVLKEKIKEQIKAQDKNLDELARIISEANHQRWKKKIENCGGTDCFEEKLEEFFHKSCQANQQKGK